MADKKIIRFLWATALVAGLCVLAGFYTECFMGCLLCGTALIVVFQIQSMSDEQSRSSLVIQGILSLLFSLSAGHFMAYLAFYEVRIERTDGNRKSTEEHGRGDGDRGIPQVLRILLPGIFCFLGTLGLWLTTGKMSFEKGAKMIMPEMETLAQVLPYLLWQMLLLTACAGMFFAIEFAVKHSFGIHRDSTTAIREAAIRELYEKKINKELRMKHYLAEQNARLEERETISRNIHNSVGHTIMAAVMTLDAAELLVDMDSAKAKERMVTAKERMKEGLTAIRCAVRVLDKESKGVSPEDFLRELWAVTEGFMMDTERTVKTDVDMASDLPEIPKVHTEFLTGAVQELLTNGVKHGNATRFFLSVRADSAHLQVSVRDNGAGDFSEENKEAKIMAGFGLRKMISYLKKCGGTARFTNENGFCAVLTVPLLWEEADGEE